MNAGLGHNGGPTLEGGRSWRNHCWRQARAELVPTLPIEVVRRRVARAKELGLPYKTYASVRASTGRDVIGFLFSSNALRSFLDKEKVPEQIVRRVADIRNAARIGFLVPPLSEQRFRASNPGNDWLDRTSRAPALLASWADAREATLAALYRAEAPALPADGVVLVGDTMLERGWAEAARLGGYLNAEQIF